jgi:hypothetical protein
MTAGRGTAAGWNSAEFHHWYSQMPVNQRKRKAWDDLSPDQRKLYTEWWTFGKFARVAPLDIDPRTIQNCEPPEPDILCRISRTQHYFELGEVTDKTLAQSAGVAAKKGQDVFSGEFSPLKPLARIFDQKCSKTYNTGGHFLHLLLHYSIGHQVPHPTLVTEIEKARPVIVSKLQNSPFSSLWLYDGWDSAVIAYVQR